MQYQFLASTTPRKNTTFVPNHQEQQQSLLREKPNKRGLDWREKGSIDHIPYSCGKSCGSSTRGTMPRRSTTTSSKMASSNDNVGEIEGEEKIKRWMGFEDLQDRWMNIITMVDFIKCHDAHTDWGPEIKNTTPLRGISANIQRRAHASVPSGVRRNQIQTDLYVNETTLELMYNSYGVFKFMYGYVIIMQVYILQV